MAARAGQVEVVRCLLRNGALVDARARVGILLKCGFFGFLVLRNITEAEQLGRSNLLFFF